MPRQLYLVAYDIADPGRLARALRCVREFALGGQKSVFECWLDTEEHKTLLHTLSQTIDPRTDRFFIVRLNRENRVRILGIGRKPQDPSWFYVG